LSAPILHDPCETQGDAPVIALAVLDRASKHLDHELWVGPDHGRTGPAALRWPRRVNAQLEQPLVPSISVQSLFRPLDVLPSTPSRRSSGRARPCAGSSRPGPAVTPLGGHHDQGPACAALEPLNPVASALPAPYGALSDLMLLLVPGVDSGPENASASSASLGHDARPPCRARISPGCEPLAGRCVELPCPSSCSRSEQERVSGVARSAGRHRLARGPPEVTCNGGPAPLGSSARPPRRNDGRLASRTAAVTSSGRGR